MSRREQVKARNRQRLIEAAARAFAAQGLKGANINLISLEAGLGKGTVYNYFASKEELFGAVLAWAGEEMEKALAEVEAGPGPVKAQLKALITALLSFYGPRPNLAKLLIRNAAADRVEHQRALLAVFQPFLSRLQQVLAAGESRGELRMGLDPFLSALTLWGMVNHQAAFHWLVSTRPLEPDGLAEVVLTYFLAGVKR